MIILVAAFNILSTLIMIVMEKTREIGVLKTMGATNGTVVRIFVLEGLIIGGAGTVLGVAGGLFLCWILQRSHFQLPAQLYAMKTVPVIIQPWDVVLIAATAVVISVLATIYPAWRAARLQPVEAIQYE